MVHLNELQMGQDYCCQQYLNLYKASNCKNLVTQAARGRHLHILNLPDTEQFEAVQVCLCEDDYPGWVGAEDMQYLTISSAPYQAQPLSTAAIQSRLPEVIRFAHAAMATPNIYLWGGTVAPNYDCSGLIQAAFASVGIMLPRDSYQQEAFIDMVAIADLLPGDLLFFGTHDRTTHVALYLGEGQYIHSSGKEQGRNGIGIDSITDRTDPVSLSYHQQLCGAGRVTQSYQPTRQPMPCR